nr:hypothetical protein [Pseudohalocynthiibacter aestuariivivens]
MILAALVALISFGASAADAACYAEYKAKQDNPFKLHYSVAQISAPCTMASARAQLSSLLASQGLTLLKVLSVRQQ